MKYPYCISSICNDARGPRLACKRLFPNVLELPSSPSGLSRDQEAKPFKKMVGCETNPIREIGESSER